MGRQPCCDKVGLKRGPWTIEEDQKLIGFIVNNGIQCWRLVPKLAGLMRCGKSCRLRWTNYLRPDLKRGGFSEDEEDRIIELHSQLGNKWSKIASHFPGRTDNEIKNYWNTRIKKRLKLLGVDPVTHKHIQNHNSNIRKEDEDKILTSQDQNVLDLTLEKDKLENNVNEAILLAKPSPSSSISFSSSVDESLNSSFEGSNLCWDTIDSFPSWEALYYLDDVLSFVNYS